jgi:hypothetical protein
MVTTVNPIHLTHVILGFIWGVVVLGLTTVELYFVGTGNITTMDIFFVVGQNVGIASANSYYLSKISQTASGITETTSLGKT